VFNIILDKGIASLSVFSLHTFKKDVVTKKIHDANLTIQVHDNINTILFSRVAHNIISNALIKYPTNKYEADIRQ
jgi:hypothetical protein